MDRYRELVAALVRHSNTITEINSVMQYFCEGVYLKNHEIQVLEYIIDKGNAHTNMTEIVHALSIPQSSFSRISSTLHKAGLIEKYHSDDNRKNIHIRPTQLGKKAYTEYAARKNEASFSRFFEELKGLDDNSITVFTNALNTLTDSISQNEADNISHKR